MEFKMEDWRKDYLNTKRRISKYERDLIENGATNFMQALILKNMKRRYDKMMGTYKPTPEPPNCQSSFKEWNDRIQTTGA